MPETITQLYSKDGRIYPVVGEGITISQITQQIAQIETDLDTNSIIEGYFLNNNFYTENNTSSELCTKSNISLYVDLNTYCFYRYNGNLYGFKKILNLADATHPGIMKLYSDLEHENTDGSVTQKCIKNSIDNIKFEVDSLDSECLILGK